MNRLAIPFCFFMIVMLAAGCERRETLSPKKPEAEPGREKTFLIGLIPEQNIFKQMERYEPFADYLSKKVSLSIRLIVLPRYGNIINSFVSSGMDGAFFGSFSYALAHEKLGVEVLARPLSLDGTSTYHGLIFVRKDSGIKSIRQMEGKRFAFVDKATTAGYLLPLAYFKKHGKNYKAFLKESYLTGTHEDAIFDVLNRKADIGAAKNTVYERMAASDERIKKELVILERSPDVPENGLAVRKNLDGFLKKKLKEALLTMHENPEGAALLKAFGARQFIETKDSDYQPVYRYAQEIELNLATYDYMNE
jgi:phosphonate transport system substrate-binding protein